MIVKSILDTDLYKFTTSYAYMKLFPQARGTFDNLNLGSSFLMTSDMSQLLPNTRLRSSDIMYRMR